MGKFRFSEATIKAGFLVENPGWYRYEITKHTERPSDAGDSINHFLTFEGRCPGQEMDGVPVSVLFNEKGEWAYYPLFIAVNNGNPIAKDQEIDWNDLIGVQVEAMTKRGERFGTGAPQNVFTDFRPVQ